LSGKGFCHFIPLCMLSGDKFNGIILRLGILKAQLTAIPGRMTRILLRSRRLMAVSVLLLLAGVVVLSTATRKPCLHASTAPWHLWKAGHMSLSEGQEMGRLRVNAEAQTLQAVPEEGMLPSPTIYLPLEESAAPAISVVVQIRHFRAPPTIG